MRYLCSATLASVLILVPSAMPSARKIELSNLTVGRNLEMAAHVTVVGAAVDQDVHLTIKSSNPNMLLLTMNPEEAGTPSIKMTIPRGANSSQAFFVQGLKESGKATYEASAPEFGVAKGTVTLAPSGIVIKTSLGFGKPFPPLTATSHPSKITVCTALLSSSREFVELQSVAGGLSVSVNLNSSNPQVGIVKPSTVKINGGTDSAVTHFEAAALGDTTVGVALPEGFRAAAEYSTLTATVNLPSFSLTDHVFIGNNLEIPGFLGLGAQSPEAGVRVTLTSNNPSRLLLSATQNEPGSPSVTIFVPPGGYRSDFFLHSLSDNGTETYTAAAPGFRSRTATVTLTPSGVMVGIVGPPDEAEYFNKAAGDRQHGVGVSMAQGGLSLGVYTAFLDPTNHRGADITVEALRFGVSLTVDVESSNPAVATVSSPLTISGGASSTGTKINFLSPGITVLSVKTPVGFTTPANATSLKVTVRP